MEVYFYCSYEHSQKGFFMTRLDQGTLVPADNVPESVESFFSYDRFSVLWYDVCQTQKQTLWKPEPNGAFFGIRNIRGQMAQGRRVTANMVLTAGEEEMTWLRRVALTVLGDYPTFQRQLTGWLGVGGHSYTLDTERFLAWLEACGESCRVQRLAEPKSKAASMLLWMQRTQPPRIEPELLRLAVCTSHWKDVQTVMGQGAAWKLKHPCALTPEEFEQVLIAQAPVWSLES